jgi:hypothetical protein
VEGRSPFSAKLKITPMNRFRTREKEVDFFIKNNRKLMPLGRITSIKII